MPDTDFELLEAWQAGDAAAGRELFARHFEAVYRFFFNKVDEATDDLLQQTFLACVEAKDDFRRQSSFRTFLFGIARNKLYKYVRGRARSREDGPPESQAEVMSIAGAMAQAQEQRLLLRALRKLPIEMQVALELSYWENLTDRELAELMEVPVGTVKSRLRKGRQLLETQMQTLASDPDQLRSTLASFDTWADSIRELAKRGPDRA